MTEKDFVFYMGGDVFFNEKKVASLKIDGPPLIYLLSLHDDIFCFSTRDDAINKIIESLKGKNDKI